MFDRLESRGPVRLAVALLASSLLVAACGGAGAGTAAAPAKTGPGSAAAASPAAPAQLRNVTLQLPWLVAGYDAPFYVAKDEGWYKDAGLNVTLTPGTSSLQAAELVADGKVQYAYVDSGAMAGVISRGGNAIMVSSFQQESPVGMVHSSDVPITSAQDLKGKTIFANAAGGPVIQLLYAVLARAGMSKNDIHLQIVDPTAEVSTFEAHPQDIMLSFWNSAYPAIVEHMPNAVFTPYAALGVNVLSEGIAVNGNELKHHPASVKGFVQATVRAYKYTIAHPTQAIQMMMKDVPGSNQAILTKSLQVSLPLLHTPATQGKPIGWMSPADWQTSLDLLHTYSTLKNVLPANKYYTDEFVGGPQG